MTTDPGFIQRSPHDPPTGSPISSERDDSPTLRDQFAMAALTGLLSNDRDPTFSWLTFARKAYAAADAMLLVRKGKERES